MNFLKQVEFSDHTGPIYCLTNHNDYLFSTGVDKYIVRWNLNSLKQDNFVINVQFPAYSILHSTVFPFLIIGCSNGDIHVVNTECKQELKFIQHHNSAIFSILEIPDKKLIITGDSNGNICIWSIPEFKLLMQIPLNCGKIRTLIRFTNELIVGSKDGKIRFFDLDYFNQIDEISVNNYGVQSIEISDSNLLVGGYDGYLSTFDSIEKKQLFRIPAHKGPIYSVKNINPRNFVTASRDKSIKIWDSQSMQVIEKKDFKSGGHRNSVNQIIGLSKDKFASCSDDFKIILWTINPENHN